MTSFNTQATYTLQLTTLLRNEHVAIEFDDNLKYIQLTWLKHPESDIFRSMFNTAVAYCIEYNSELWYSDARAIHYLEFADQKWVLTNIAPQLPLTKVRKFARLSSLESISLMDINHMYDAVEEKGVVNGTKCEIFTDKNEALHWLFSEV